MTELGLKRDLTVLGVMIIMLVSFTFTWSGGDLGSVWKADAVQYVDSPVLVSAATPRPTNFTILNFKQVTLYLKLNNTSSQSQSITVEVQAIDSNGDIVHNTTTTLAPQTATLTIPQKTVQVLTPFSFAFDHVDRYLREFLIIITGPGYVMSWSLSNTGSSTTTLAVVSYSTTSSYPYVPKAKLLNPPWAAQTLLQSQYYVKQVRTVFNPNWKSRFEIVAIVMGTDIAGNQFYLYAYVYDGLKWNGPLFLGQGSGFSGTPQARPFDIAYEGTSSRAIVVWNNKYDGNNAKDLAYMIWDGTAWGDGTTYGTKGYINTMVSGETDTIDDFSYIRLETNPMSGSNEIALMGLCKTSLKAKIFIWGGSSWGNSLGLCTSTNQASTDSYECFDIGYEYSTGRIVAVAGNQYIQSSNTRYRVRYATYLSGSWVVGTSFGTGGSTSNVINYLVLKPQRVSGATRMMLLSLDGGADIYARVYNGGAAFAGSSTAINTNVQTFTSRCMDGNWEPTGNKFLLIYGPSGTTGSVTWRTWTPTAWSVATTSTITGLGTQYWIKAQTNLKNADPKILIGVVDSTNQLVIMRWTGTAISSASDGLFTNLSSTTYEGFALACSYP